MTDNINLLAVRASNTPEAREQLIAANEQTILRTASRLCRRYITKSDDEWSISLCAFSRAVDRYSSAKGDFLPFALMLIKRSLTDYYRSQEKVRREICVSPDVFNGDAQSAGEEDGKSEEMVRAAVAGQCTQAAENPLKTEVLAANEMLQEYGFRFYDLVECSPKQDRSRKECAEAVRCALRSPGLCHKLCTTKRLPVRELSKESGVSKKTIDRYRKYIIMSILILNGEFPGLASYLRFIRPSA